jgi:fermentation-respiration switch protein FrsA (DUF1100 family)
MTQRVDIAFTAEGGVTLRGWLYLPEGPGPYPAITMAHGYAGVKEHGLERFAEAFAADGLVVLVHDHRTFGASDGTPRQDVDPWQQTDRRLRCVVAQVPTISGYEQGLRRVPPDAVVGLEEALAEDERAQLRGEAPRMQAIVRDDPAVSAAYRAKDAIEFYLQPVPTGSWEDQVTVRSTRAARMYEPGAWISRVSPTPLLLVVADHDTITVTDLALAAYERALEPKKLVLLPGGHFDPYLSRFGESSAAARDWFRRHLS